MDINLTRKEFLDLKKWINLEIKCAEGYIENKLDTEEAININNLKNSLDELVKL